MKTPLPALFLGHGNPMNALRNNGYTRAWAALGTELLTASDQEKPRAILVISAHWYVPGTRVTAMDAPRTIHDFGGFPRELFQYSYPAPGDPVLATHIAQWLKPVAVELDHNWGLDHGAWAVLCHVFPDAGIPVIQLSIDSSRPPSFHYQLARQLAPLRDDGVLIIGSGNIVHNLARYAWNEPTAEPADWALRFEQATRKHLLDGHHEALIHPEQMGDDALLAVPTAEHYLPLVYLLGLQRSTDAVTFPVEGFDGGTISMLSVRIG